MVYNHIKLIHDKYMVNTWLNTWSMCFHSHVSFFPPIRITGSCLGKSGKIHPTDDPGVIQPWMISWSVAKNTINPCHVYHPWRGRGTIPPIKMVMTGVCDLFAWFQWLAVFHGWNGKSPFFKYFCAPGSYGKKRQIISLIIEHNLGDAPCHVQNLCETSRG